MLCVQAYHAKHSACPSVQLIGTCTDSAARHRSGMFTSFCPLYRAAGSAQSESPQQQPRYQHSLPAVTLGRQPPQASVLRQPPPLSQMQTALQSRKRYRAAFESSPDAGTSLPGAQTKLESVGGLGNKPTVKTLRPKQPVTAASRPAASLGSSNNTGNAAVSAGTEPAAMLNRAASAVPSKGTEVPSWKAGLKRQPQGPAFIRIGDPSPVRQSSAAPRTAPHPPAFPSQARLETVHTHTSQEVPASNANASQTVPKTASATHQAAAAPLPAEHAAKHEHARHTLTPPVTVPNLSTSEDLVASGRGTSATVGSSQQQQPAVSLATQITPAVSLATQITPPVVVSLGRSSNEANATAVAPDRHMPDATDLASSMTVHAATDETHRAAPGPGIGTGTGKRSIAAASPSTPGLDVDPGVVELRLESLQQSGKPVEAPLLLQSLGRRKKKKARLSKTPESRGDRAWQELLQVDEGM